MTREAPGPGCADHAVDPGCRLDEGAGLAREAYACALLRGTAAWASRAAHDPGLVTGLHVCGLTAPVPEGQWQDLEAFGREMARQAGEGGLGWS